MHAVLTHATKGDILERLKAQGVMVHANPDVLVLTYSDVSVDDARHIATYAALKAVEGEKHIIISFDRAGVEAQNALLKVVEDAPGNSHFYFCTPNPGAVIHTLRSRCIVEHNIPPVDRTAFDDATSFLALGYSDRLSFIEKMVTRAQRAQDRSEVRAFARALAHVRPCRDTLDSVRYLDQNGSSPKLVLSHLAVVL